MFLFLSTQHPRRFPLRFHADPGIRFTGAKTFKALPSQAYIALHLFPVAWPVVGTSFCRFPSTALRYWQYLRSVQDLFSLKFLKEIQMVKWMMPAAAAFLLAACSMGGHDTSDTSGTSAGTTSSSSMPSSYPTGTSSGASDVGTSGSSASGTSSSDSTTGTSSYPSSSGSSSYPSTSGSSGSMGADPSSSSGSSSSSR